MSSVEDILAAENELTHVGRVPAGADQSGRLRDRLAAARREMTAAVSGEDYEAAARLRDEIARLESLLAAS